MRNTITKFNTNQEQQQQNQEQNQTVHRSQLVMARNQLKSMRTQMETRDGQISTLQKQVKWYQRQTPGAAPPSDITMKDLNITGHFKNYHKIQNSSTKTNNL